MGSTADDVPDRLAPRRILVVEDEIFIALELELVLLEAGYEVIGPAPAVAAALRLLAGRAPDAAVLDMNLRGERVTPVAEVLVAKAVPFVLTSAYGEGELGNDPALAGARNIGKPTNHAALLEALREILP